MKWTRFQKPQHVERMTLLVAVSLLLWMIAGDAKAQKDPNVLLPSKTKGPRVSIPQVGILYLREFFRRLTTAFALKHLPLPTLKRFAELQPVERSGSK